MVQLAGREQLAHERGRFGGALDGEEELEKTRAVVFAGVVLKGAAEREMAWGAVVGGAGGVGGEEGEGAELVGLVLGEVEADAADDAEGGVASDAPGGDGAGGADGGAGRGEQLDPEGAEGVEMEVLAAEHGRSGGEEGSEIVVGRRKLERLPVAIELGMGAERGEKEAGESAPEGEDGRKVGRSVGGDELEEAGAGAGGEGAEEAARGGLGENRRRGIVVGGEGNAEMGREEGGEGGREHGTGRIGQEGRKREGKCKMGKWRMQNREWGGV
jgi:hypothetical protein